MSLRFGRRFALRANELLVRIRGVGFLITVAVDRAGRNEPAVEVLMGLYNTLHDSDGVARVATRRPPATAGRSCLA